MSFMQHQITSKQQWHQLDTRNEGIVAYPADMFTAEWVAKQHKVDVDDVETITGYGARISAPGYMDCTEWCVFDTEAQAQAYLDEMYPEDEDEDED